VHGARLPHRVASVDIDDLAIDIEKALGGALSFLARPTGWAFGLSSLRSSDRTVLTMRL